MLAEPEPDDEALLARAREGDRAAFARIVERNYDFIHRLAWRWCGNRADAEDVSQEVCIRLGRAIRGFRGDGAFRTWLYQLVLNAARDQGRRFSRDMARLHEFAADPMSVSQGAAEPDDAAERLWARVRELPAKQREAITLVYGEGLSHAAASDVLGCSENTVSWHVHEARKRLKQMVLEGRED